MGLVRRQGGSCGATWLEEWAVRKELTAFPGQMLTTVTRPCMLLGLIPRLCGGLIVLCPLY